MLYSKYAQDGAYHGHIILLTQDEKSIKSAFDALKECPMQIGGGITPSNAMQFIRHGATHVIVTSYVFHDGAIDFERLHALVHTVGKDKLILDLSCRKKSNDDEAYYVMTNRWQTFTNVQVNQATLDTLSEYCAEFLIHAVDVEGKKNGIELELVHRLASYTSIPITYAGGVSSMQDVEQIQKVGGNKIHVSIGSSLDLFGGHIPYKDVILWNKNLS